MQKFHLNDLTKGGNSRNQGWLEFLRAASLIWASMASRSGKLEGVSCI